MFTMELLHADDLVITAESIEGLSVKLENWRLGMEAKCLMVNTKNLFTSLGNIPVESAQKVLEAIQYNVHLAVGTYML